MPLYDTSIFVAHIRGNPKARAPIEKLWDGVWPVSVSSITVFELHFGCFVARDMESHRQLVEQYLVHVSSTLPVDDAVAYQAAAVQAELRSRNQMIDPRDLFIAATALVHDLSVCTLDVEHFGRIPRLRLEDLP